MIGIDTNVLVRYLVADNEAQTDRVRQFLASSRAAGELAFVPVIVLCEAYWVLRSVFARPSAEILDALERLLETDVFRVENEDAVRTAFRLARKGKGELSDHLIGQLNLARGCTHTVTFDRALRRADGFKLL